MADPRQVTTWASAFAVPASGSKLRPDAAAVMPIRRRREIGAAMPGSVRMLVTMDGRGRGSIAMQGFTVDNAPRRLGPAPKNVVARHLREADDLPAVVPRERFGLRAVGERHRLVGAHAALHAAADDEVGALGVEPILGARIVPRRCLAH